LDDPQPLADGAVFTSRGFAAITDAADGNFSRYLLGVYADGADRAAFAHRVDTISRKLGEDAGVGGITGPAVPVEIDHVRQIGWLPALLATLFAGLGLAAVGHALVTGVRRRRRELAVLQTLGFNRRQIRMTVAWQATTLAVVGLVVGLPLGILVGNLAWRVVADGLGVATTSVTPLLALLLLPAVVVLLNVVAFFPANAAARARPALALAVE
jgi:predicted lysophospholipase L1 biosynthesis ABC-type transport system permease subunit